jgi:hypothetical protein
VERGIAASWAMLCKLTAWALSWPAMARKRTKGGRLHRRPQARVSLLHAGVNVGGEDLSCRLRLVMDERQEPPRSPRSTPIEQV